jgi:glutathione S-transferase
MDIPPQYGPGYSDSGKEVEDAQRAIDGDTTWVLPVNLSANDLEPTPDSMNASDEAARHEAAYMLTANAKAITKFACRGKGEKGAKQFGAPLADPYAVPNLNYESKVDELLRVTASLLLDGTAEPSGGKTSQDGADVAKCLAYLRDRIGVPRDMSYPAAMQLRAHLNYVMDAV